MKFVGEMQQLARKRSQKNNQDVISCITFHFLFIHWIFQNSAPFNNNKDAEKLSVFGENDSCCSSNFLQAHMFWKFDHMSRTYNQISYRNNWFSKVIIVLLMTAQVLFFDVFSEEDTHLNAVEGLSSLNPKIFCYSDA